MGVAGTGRVMPLPLRPPVRPMLARLVRELPEGDYRYEPKWDGFRCLVFRDGSDVDLRSRNDRPFARYFPELVEALGNLAEQQLVVDGEIMVVSDGRASFEALLARQHPAASRAARLAVETPASFVAFDLLARGDQDLTTAPFVERRAILDEVFAGARPPLYVTPITADPATAARWFSGAGAGLDGVMAKDPSLGYEPGKRSMIKVKPERTLDCVVAGARLFADPVRVASLLLGLYDEAGVLRHVGVASSFGRSRAVELVEELASLVVPLADHPWANGFGLEGGRLAHLRGAASRWTPDLTLDWLPLRPDVVCEVSYDHASSGRFRHPARLRRWRPDRDARSCLLEQLEEATAANPVLPA